MPGRTAIPQTAADITPQWLTAALRERGHLDERNEVASIATTDVGAGRGFVGQTLRLDLTYEREGASGPASLIAKMPLGYEIPAEQQEMLSFIWLAELSFYAEYGESAPVRVPRPYWVGIDWEDKRFCLLLENLGHLTSVAQIDGCTPEQADLAVRALALIHARWWSSPDLEGRVWIPGAELRAVTGQLLFAGGWPFFVKQFPDKISPRLRAAGDRLVDEFTAFAMESVGHAHTMVHGDYRVENFFFGPSGPDEFVVYDWQLAGLGAPATDLAYFVSQSLTTEVRRACEADLLASYLDALHEAGVADYTSDDLARDYERGMLSALVIPVNGSRMLQEIDVGGEADQEMIEQLRAAGAALMGILVDRVLTAIEDHEAYAALE